MLNVTWHTYAMIAAGLAIIYLLPRLTNAIPSPLICIVVLTVISIIFPMPLHTVADLGQLPMSLPSFHQIGRASCRERACQYVSISVVAASLQEKRDR